MESTPLQTFSLEASQLMCEFPPQWRHPNKVYVWQSILADDQPWLGKIEVKQWPKFPMPEEIMGPLSYTIRQGAFAYEHAAANESHWHLNFADPVLFVAYGSMLLAQDELQVLEHPILGSLREYFNAKSITMRTLDQSGMEPTPVTITNVQRRCALDTVLFPIYGNAFARASQQTLQAALRILNPAPMSNILAMSALPGGYGQYTHEEIQSIFINAFTGFSAAKKEDERSGSAGIKTIIHTGFWGCGVFGGNRTLMTILQGLAAAASGVELVFWALGSEGVSIAQAAFAEANLLLNSSQTSIATLLQALTAKGFLWGHGDGN